jgi:CheY-like chemotaxis protein
MAPTLLLADDSVTIQRVVELTFADEDILVRCVSDGDEAIAAIESSPPDIILADIGMPGRTGYEVAEHVRGTPRLAHIPVILLAGAFEPVDESRATPAVCDAVLAKPFDPQVAIARVKELLARSGALQPALTTRKPLAAVGPRPADFVRLDNYFDELDAALASLPEIGPLSLTGSEAATADAADAAKGVATEAFHEALSNAPDSPLRDQESGSAAPSGELASDAATETGASSTAAAAPPSGATSEIVDEVTRRVLDRLAGEIGRAQVADVVSAVAERLVREEIERIKSSIT